MDSDEKLKKEIETLEMVDKTLQMLCVEFGFRSCEKGNNLEKTLEDYGKIMKLGGYKNERHGQ